MNVKPSLQPTDLSSFVTYRMARTQNKLNAQATALLKAHSDLSLVEWRVISLVRLHDGASMSNIASAFQMDKGQLSRKVAAMTQKGLLRFVPDEEDHRMHHLHLTDEAEALASRLTPIMRKRQPLLVDGVSQQDLDTFFDVLGRIDG